MSKDAELPVGWTSVKLSELAAPRSSRVAPSDHPILPFVGLEHVEAHTMRLLGSTPASSVVSASARFSAGDVLYGRLRPYLNKVINPDFDGLCSAEFIVFPDTPHLRAGFLKYRLNAADFVSFASGLNAGDRPRVDFGQIGGFEIQLPRPEEQRRIIAKIDELFSDLDAGVAALLRARANLKRYRAAVLKAAVEGKLTEQWRAEHPATEPASKLLERILTGRRKKWEADQLARFDAAGKTPPKDWREKYVEPAGPDAAELPALPAEWCWTTLAVIAAIEGGVTKDQKRQRTPTTREVPYLRVANVQRGLLDLRVVKTILAEAEEIESLRLRKGDILFTEGGDRDKLGRGWVWNDEIEDCIHQNHIFRARLFLPLVEPKFVSFHGNFFGQRWFTKTGKQTTNLASINKGVLSRFPIPLPPLTEQRRIVAEVEERLSVVDEVEAQIGADLQRAARLRQSILKRAFEGKLVAQDPADEPASVLLGRIRESRETELRIHPAARAARARPVASGVRRKQPAGNIFRRGAVASYIVRTLADRPSFGRTQLGKVLHLTQAHLGVDLALEFQRYPAGPLDTAIYKLEDFAQKQDWFSTENRPSFGVRYHPGPNLGERCDAAVAVLGDKRAALDELLAHVAKMDADRAELFATVYAAWNDLLIDGRPATPEAIIAEVHGWDESKKRFAEDRITRCIDWMRKHGYIPTGTGQRTQLRPPVSEKKSRRGRKKP